MITELDISKKLGRSLRSPIRVGHLSEIDIDSEKFLEYYRPYFEELHDDLYMPRQKQLEFLINALPDYESDIQKVYAAYFRGDGGSEVIQQCVDQLSGADQRRFETLSRVTRQRNIAKFICKKVDKELVIKRKPLEYFGQDVEDFRSLVRRFEEASVSCVENELFLRLLSRLFGMVEMIHKDLNELQVTSHFMRTLCFEKMPGENAPEGVHEDGARYIVSALVINRMNVTGGKSQIYERSKSGEMEVVYCQILQPGEFIFQADTGEEEVFGNDLWHYVTPVNPVDENQLAVRDIIGFDLDIID